MRPDTPVTPTYDGNGNLTYDGAFTYCYDAENRLTSVYASGTCASPGTAVAAYTYDAQGRRRSKTVGGVTTIYVTDADNREVLEYDGTSGAIKAWYAYGPGSNEVLNRMDVTAGTRQTFVPDIQGSFIGMLNSGTGALAKRGYLPFGESPTTSGSFAYTGLRIDPETNGLYYARARIYSPRLGRFVQPDPIGYAGGVNLYAYVYNDPLNLTDPEGLAVENLRQAAISSTVRAAEYVTQNLPRAPDFINFQVDYYVGSAWGTFSRSGNSFVGVGLNRAYASPVGAGASISAGWLNAANPTLGQIDNFIGGYSGGATAAYAGVGGGLLYSPGNGSATVIGAGASVQPGNPSSVGGAIIGGRTFPQGQTGIRW